MSNLQKVQMAMLAQDVHDKFTSTDAQLAQIAINVKQPPYNAKSNGIDDDYPAIQNAINSLGTTGGKILIPNGTYLLSKPLKLPDYVRLEGLSKNGTTLQRTGHGVSDVLAFDGSSVDAVIHIVGTVGGDNKNVQSYGNEISNLHLVGQSTTLTDLTPYGIYCQGLAMSKIDNVRIEYIQKGLFSQAYIWNSELTNIRSNVCYSGFEIWSATSLFMKDCYASNYRDFGYIANQWYYSHMSNCAADWGGNRSYWTDTTLLAVAYKFRNCKGMKVTSGGSENTNGLALYLDSNDSLTIENMLHLNMYSDYTGTNVANIVGAYRISNGTNVKLENNRFEFKNPAYSGVGNANSSHYKRYINGISEGLQLINNKIVGCPWQDSGATTDSMDLSSRWLLGNVTSADATIYVNYTSGNDLTGDGSSGTPYKTISKALATLSRIIDHTITIQLQDSDYLENPVISGFQGKGELIIQGNLTTNTNTRVRGTSTTPMTVKRNTCTVTFNSLGLYSDANNGISLNVIDNPGIVEAKNSVIASWSGSYTGTIGIFASRSPFILSTNNTGSTTKTALNATLGSTIIKNGTQPTGGSVNEAVSTGGVIR